MSAGVKRGAGYNSAIAKFIAQAREAAEEVAVGMAKHMFEYAIQESPQYSGDYAANWKVSYGKIIPSFISDAVGMTKGEPFKRGDTPAMTFARAHADWDGFRLGQAIHLHNSATHSGENYAFKIENNEIAFRPVNQGAHTIARRSFDTVARKLGAKMTATDIALYRRFA